MTSQRRRRPRPPLGLPTLGLFLAAGLGTSGPGGAGEPYPAARTPTEFASSYLAPAAQPAAEAATQRLAPPAPSPQVPAPPAGGLTLDLAGCLQVALARHPRIAAARASLQAAEDGKRALEELQVPVILVRELPVRRRQGAVGIQASAAGVDQAEREVAYAVTRTYLTVLYAREQERVTAGVVERLSAINEILRRLVDAGARDVSLTDVNRTGVYLSLARTRQTQAAQGVKRALAALKEATALGPEACLDVPAGRFPETDLRLNRCDVVAWALARRPELLQAQVFADVACLEVDAQGTSLNKRMETFAAGTDLHAHQVPQETRDGEYRPGALAPEMPGMLAGTRPERVRHAHSLYLRARAVVEVTRNLIGLEAEDAFLRWEEATQQVAQAKEAAEGGDRLADDLDRDFKARAKVKVDEVISARVLAAQARSQYNEFLYRQLVSLADLERVTAGAFSARLPERVLPRPAPARETPEKGKEEKKGGKAKDDLFD